MKITNFGKKLLAFLLVVTSAFFLFACQQGGTGESGTSPRAEAKQHVQQLLSQFKFGDTIDGVCTEIKTSNFEIQEDLDGIVSEEDLANNSYSEYKHGLTASFESNNPDVLHAEWQTSVTRNYVTDAEGKIVGIEIGERKALVFVVNPQAEATNVVVTITVSGTYEVNGREYTYKDSQDTTFTIGAKVGDAVEMTIGEMQALAMADWASFTNNGLVDAEGNKYSVAMKGVVTEELWGDGSDSHSFMMSDENGDNVFVYAPSGSCMIGDEVIVTGVPAAYYDGIQIGKGATVQVLSGGHEVAAPLEMSIDEWYANYDIKVNHNAVGERIKTKAILVYDGSNYILKSTESDKYFAIYYKSYNSYELELLQQFLGKVAVYEFAVYDHHSAGYWRALVNNYDYVPEEVVLTDQEALDADLTTIPTEFEVKEGETVEIPTGELVNGSVIGTWSADHEGLVDVETGKVTLDGLKETTVVTLTAAVTKGSAVAEVQIKVTIVYVKPEGPTYSVTTEHEVGVAYKFGMLQENLGKELFLSGELDGNFFASVEDPAAAADVYLEAAEGGYYFYFEKDGAKKYICIANDTGYISFSDAPSNVWTYNEEYNTLVSNVYNDTFYLGSYKEFATFSKSKISYAATSFVAHLYQAEGATSEPTCEVTTEHEVGVAYKFGMVQGNLGKELFLSGELDGNFFASVEDPAAAADVYLEAAEGGYYFYFEKDGAKKYICIANDTGYISFSDAPSNVWTYNEEYNTLVSNVYNDTFYLGSYKEFTTFSKSKISYAATSFVAHLYKYGAGSQPEQPEEPTCEVTTEHEIGVAYKFGMIQSNLGKELFLSGLLDGNFFASVEDPAEAADVYLEAAEGGYYFYFVKDGVKKYICIANDTGYISFSDTPSNVWTYNEEYNTLVSNVYNDTFYLGSYKEFATFSKSKISYAATSFVAHLYKYGAGSQPEQPEQPEQPSVITTVAGALAGAEGSQVELTGKVVEIYQAWSDQYKNISFYIEDATGKILVFRTGTLAEIGDTVTVKGTIAVYNNVNQIGQGAITEVIEKAPVEEPEPEATSAVIKFDNKANRTEFSEEIQVWEQNGIKVTNTKHESTQPIADYANPARFYAKTRLVISAENKISKIVFTTAGGKNFNANFALAGFIVTVNGTSCTIESAEGVDNITIDLGYQVRVSQIEVFFAGAGNDPEPEPEPEQPEEPEQPSVITTVAGALAGAEGSQVELTGKVVEIYQAWSDQYKNISFYIEDATGKILVFRTGTLVEVGDTVKVQGTVTVYSGTNQIAQGCTTEIIEKAPVVEPEPEPELPEGTVVVKIADYAAANGWANGVMYNTLQLNDKVSAQLSAVAGSGSYGANTGKYYTSGNNWRMYQADQEATLVITAVEGTKIVSVKVTYSVKNSGTLLLGETAIESGNVVEVNASSITFTVGNTNPSITNGQAQITAIQVVLEAEAAEPVVTGGRADLETMDFKGSGNYTGGTGTYTSLTSTNGWVSNNAALLVGGTTDANPVFQFIGADNTTKAVTINGKTSAKGTLTSPTLQGGISKITFNYGHAFSDKKGVDINVIITEVATGNVITLNLKKEAADVTQKTAYVAEFVLEAPVAGEFTIQFTNNCPTNSTKNADRVSLWNIEWVGYVA